MVEEFRIIKGFENYSVSNFGNIKNNKTGKILKPRFTKGLYYIKQLNTWSVEIRFNGKNKNLGWFDKIEDAINARVIKEEEFKKSCEKEININLNIPNNTKVNLNINIKSQEDQKLEELEKEFNDILNKK